MKHLKLITGLSVHLILGVVFTVALFHPIVTSKNEVTRGIEYSMRHNR